MKLYSTLISCSDSLKTVTETDDASINFVNSMAWENLVDIYRAFLFIFYYFLPKHAGSNEPLGPCFNNALPNIRIKNNFAFKAKGKRFSYCQMIILCLISSLKCLNILIIDLKQHTAKFPNDLSFWINHSCLSMMI